MTNRSSKIIRALLNAVIVFASFEGLIAILNLNQPALFIRTAFYVGLFFIFQIFLLYDLHLKQPGSFKNAQAKHKDVQHWFSKSLKITCTAIWYRCYHLRKWKFVSQWLNYLVLPGMLFWATITLLFVNFGVVRLQQTFVFFSGMALCLNYWYLKEIFARGKEVVDRDIFVVLSVVKIYTSAIIYGSALVLIRRYCLPAEYFIAGSFSLTFLLIYQALFQHRLINIKTISVTLAISFIMAFINYGVLIYWGYNFYTAAVFMAACYNLFWGIFHYRLDKSLTWSAFWEIFVVSIIIGAMVISVTNFKARLLDDCSYTWPEELGFRK